MPPMMPPPDFDGPMDGMPPMPPSMGGDMPPMMGGEGGKEKRTIFCLEKRWVQKFEGLISFSGRNPRGKITYMNKNSPCFCLKHFNFRLQWNV